MQRSTRVLSLGLGLLVGAKTFALDLTCKTLPDLFRAYLASHYSVHSLSDEVKNHTVEQYIKGLDPSKTTLLEGDVAKFRKNLPELFTTMRSDNCQALDEAQATVLQRVEEVEAFVKNFVNKDYKLVEDVEILTDAEKRSFAKTPEERNALIAKYIHFQISNYLLSDMKLEEAKKQLIHRYELITKRVRERKNDDTLTGFADAFASALDPHSSFFSKDRLEEFRIEMSLSLEGIGASLSSQDGYTVVEEIIPGGAADRAKVLAQKDKIIAVAQDGQKPVSVIDMELRDVVKLIRGKKGTKVSLTILRQSKSVERLEVSIVRDKIQMKEQEAKLQVQNRKVGKQNFKVGIIDLPAFYGEQGKKSSFEDVKKLLASAKQQKVDGLVLNLSHNGGGLLDDAVKMSGLFIKKGGIVATQNTRKKVEVLADEDEGIDFSGPLVVLTSRASASASEILAGALKDYKRAVIVGGDHTFGKGSVQAVIPLPQDLGAIKVTTGMFFLPGGASTQHEGVAGEVPLPSVLSTDDMGEKALDYSLAPQKIDAFLSPDANSTDASRWQPLSEAELKTLADNSKARVDKDAKFTEIRKDIEEAAKNKGIIRLAEVTKKSKDDKKKHKDDEKKTNAQRLKDAEAPYVNEAMNVVMDLLQMRAGSAPAPTPATQKQKGKPGDDVAQASSR